MRFDILGIVLLSVGVSLAQDHEVQQIPSKTISNYDKLFGEKSYNRSTRQN